MIDTTPQLIAALDAAMWDARDHNDHRLANLLDNACYALESVEMNESWKEKYEDLCTENDDLRCEIQDLKARLKDVNEMASEMIETLELAKCSPLP